MSGPRHLKYQAQSPAPSGRDTPAAVRPRRHGSRGPGSGRRRLPLLLAGALAAGLVVSMTLGSGSAPRASATGTITPAAPVQQGDASLWAPTTRPDTMGGGRFGGRFELGTRFRSSTAGTVTGLRFFRVPGRTDTSTGRLRDSAGKVLAAVTFPAGTTAGWQTARLSHPVALDPGRWYVASYTTSGRSFPATRGFFSRGTYRAGPLEADAGVYATSRGRTPLRRSSSTSFFGDITFRPSAASPLPSLSPITGPTATPTRPAPTATSKPAPSPTSPPTRTSSAPAPPTPPSGKPGQDWPSEKNTGWRPTGVTLSPYTGPKTITAGGTRIDGKVIDGDLTVSASDVHVTRSWITGALIVRDGCTTCDVLAEDTEIGPSTGSIRGGSEGGVRYGNYTLRRVDLHNSSDFLRGAFGTVLVEDSYLHDQAVAAGDHGDGFQEYGPGVTANITLRHIRMDISPTNTGVTAAVFWADDPRGVLTVTGSRFSGGGYLIRLHGGSGSRASVTGNTLAPSGYGPCLVDNPSSVTWSGNVTASGAALPVSAC